MRILFMADVPAGADSGAAGTELRTMEALREAGHEVDAIWADNLGRRVRHGNLHYLLELPRAYRREMQRAMSGACYDVVHANQPHGYLAAAWLSRSGKRTIFIHRSHGVEPRFDEATAEWVSSGMAKRPLLPRMASRAMARALASHSSAIARIADGHIVSCTADADYLVARLAVPRERVAVIPQAPPDSFVETTAPSMSAGRLQTVLYVGQFAAIKAPEIIARAFSIIAEREPATRLIWACNRAHHDAVRSLFAPGIRERVDLRPWMPQEELRALYDSAGVFLFLSYEEGFGKAFLEAMSRGCCVVATRAGGMRDVITDGVDGVLVERGDAEAAATASLRIMSDPALAAAISGAASATAREYSWKRVAAETAWFYVQRHAARFGA